MTTINPIGATTSTYQAAADSSKAAGSLTTAGSSKAGGPGKAGHHGGHHRAKAPATPAPASTSSIVDVTV